MTQLFHFQMEGDNRILHLDRLLCSPTNVAPATGHGKNLSALKLKAFLMLPG